MVNPNYEFKTNQQDYMFDQSQNSLQIHNRRAPHPGFRTNFIAELGDTLTSSRSWLMKKSRSLIVENSVNVD
jgi:hypothetical protein